MVRHTNKKISGARRKWTGIKHLVPACFEDGSASPRKDDTAVRATSAKASEKTRSQPAHSEAVNSNRSFKANLTCLPWRPPRTRANPKGWSLDNSAARPKGCPFPLLVGFNEDA
jgi:hypothetical protein